MKRLILVRHGKSSWEQRLPDHERPLKERAYKDAEVVFRTYNMSQNKPDVIWSSDAVRALETAKIFKNKLQIEDSDFFVKSRLYTFSKPDLKFQIESCDDSVNVLMVFGHNPAITELVNSLGDIYFENIPTTGLVILDFEVNTWKVLKKGKIILHLFPKNVR